jgi:RNA polymerase sigma factor (sigma-70 family)
MSRESHMGSASPTEDIWDSVPDIEINIRKKLWLPNYGDAFDLVLDGVIILKEKEQKSTPLVNPKGYVYKAAIYTFYRTRKQESNRLLPLGDQEHSGNSHQNNSFDNKSEMAARIAAALLKLNENDRKIVLLRAEQIPFVEIAEMLGLRCDAVRQRHSRAATRIRKAVEDSE